MATRIYETFLATYLPHNLTYVAELARKGCRKLTYSAMPANAPGADVLVPWHNVPREIRKAAKESLLK